MEPVLKDLFNQIKITGIVNGDSLEKIYSMILDRTEKTLAQKKNQIERLYGEITQLEVTKTMLLMVLRDYMNEIKQNIADQKMSDELIAKKKAESEERLRVAMETPGREDHEMVYVEPVKQEILVDSIQEEPKSKKRSRKI